MKTKLLFCKNQKWQNHIVSFLIIFFMTVSSFGQTLEIQVDCSAIGFSALSFEFETQESTSVNTGIALDNGSEISGFVMLLQVVDNRWEVSLQGDPVRWLFTTDDDLIENPCNATWSLDTLGAIRLCDSNSVVVTCIGSPPEPEDICDGIDNDGDGFIDEDADFITYYLDFDGDGFGDPAISIETCDGAPLGYVEDNTDFNDMEDTVYPGAEEICDGLDNDGDGGIDEDITDCNNGVILEYCNDKKTKILVCHNGNDICVSINALEAHEAHGDYLGSCANARESAIAEEVTPTYGVVSWPNPTNNLFNVKMITPNTIDKVSLKTFDINGRLVHSAIVNGNEDYKFGSNLQAGVYFVKITQAENSKVLKVIKR